MPKHTEFALDLDSFYYYFSLSFYPMNFKPWHNVPEVLWLPAILEIGIV